MKWGSFAYGNANKQKLCIHEGFCSTFSLKCCETFYHIRTEHTHIFRHVVKHTDNVQWYGDVTVEHSVYWFIGAHLGASTMLWHIRLSRLHLCIFVCVHVIRAIANSICTQIFWRKHIRLSDNVHCLTNVIVQNSIQTI